MNPFDAQPASCRVPLELKPHIKTMSPVIKRVYATNPVDIYSRISRFDIYARKCSVPVYSYDFYSKI